MQRNWVKMVAAIAIISLVMIPAVSEIGARPPRRAPIGEIPDTTYLVFVADWGYHTSIIVQQPEGMELGPPGREAAAYVEYAWGDRRFYMEGSRNPLVTLAALFLPTPSVTYVEGWGPDPDRDARPRAMYSALVSATQLRQLLEGLEGSIVRDRSGARANPYPTVSGYDGRFYPSSARFLWTRDCNRWTVERLAAAGLARGGRGVLLSKEVAGRLRGFIEVER